MSSSVFHCFVVCCFCCQGSLTIRDELKAQQQAYIEKLAERKEGKVKAEPTEGERRAVDEKLLLDVRVFGDDAGLGDVVDTLPASFLPPPPPRPHPSPCLSASLSSI